MFKTILKGMVMAGAVLAISGAAQAAVININLYGASAQYLFWNDAADNFLTSQGCNGVAQDEYNSAHGITRGTCGVDTVYIRYSSKASYDGIYAIKADASNNTDGCPQSYQRKMVDESTCTDWALGGTACTALKCYDVVLGASDVRGESFIQESHGLSKGPLGGTQTDRTFSGISTAGLKNYNPLVVPFGFFANNSVTVTKCLAPDPSEPTGSHKAVSQWGNECIPDGNGNSSACIGYYKCQNLVPAHCSLSQYTTKTTCESSGGTWFVQVDGTCNGGTNNGGSCTRDNQCPDVALGATQCKAIPLDNISRLQAATIFSGQVRNWQNFGKFYPNVDIVACLRHAGSGTHATMDLAVMSGNGWGWPLAINESIGGPNLYFNDGSGDMMNCINGSGAWTGTGAIGYADADQLLGTSYYPNVHAVKYQGVEPKRVKIRNGEYDFWSVQNLYEQPSTRPTYAATHPKVLQLMAYASNPANVPSTKVDYWATADEMYFGKDTDFAYPGYNGTPPNPQTP